MRCIRVVLKIGSTTTSIDTEEAVQSAARKRIEQQTKTADIPYELLLAEILEVPGSKPEFVDKPVHRILKRSGYKSKSENVKNTHSEWFEIDLRTSQRISCKRRTQRS